MQKADKACYVQCKDYHATPMFLFCRTQTHTQAHSETAQLYSAKDEFRNLRRNAGESIRWPEIQSTICTKEKKCRPQGMSVIMFSFLMEFIFDVHAFHFLEWS